MFFGFGYKKQLEAIHEELRKSHEEQSRMALALSEQKQEIERLRTLVQAPSNHQTAHTKDQKDEVTPSRILSEYLFGEKEES